MPEDAEVTKGMTVLPLKPYLSKNEFSALMYVSEDKRRAVVFKLGLVKGKNRNLETPLKLEGLDAGMRYRVREVNAIGDGILTQRRRGAECAEMVLGGDAMMNIGLWLPFESDYQSCVLELTAEEK